MMPYLTPIFKNAAPDFYQFADAKKILTVEVTPGGAFSYQVLSKPKQYFVHTNTYVSPEFVALNQAITNTSRLESSNNRFVTMSQLIAHAPVWNLAAASQWILDTTSTQVNADNSCLNTSLFRSYLQGFNAINMNTPNDRVFGTVSTVIVNNTGDLKTSQILVRMFDAITTRSDGSQLITYRELDTTLAQLFSSDAPPPFVTHDFVRAAPVNGVCS